MALGASIGGRISGRFLIHGGTGGLVPGGTAPAMIDEPTPIGANEGLRSAPACDGAEGAAVDGSALALLAIGAALLVSPAVPGCTTSVTARGTACFTSMYRLATT
eukprot:jgi/Chrpa1/1642/Chrysochromulina_OHIO_Genome00001270-RA